MGLVFPIIVLATSTRFGGSAESVVGWGFAAASVGAALVPWLTGRVAEQTAFAGVEAVLVAGAAITAVLGWRVTPPATVGHHD